MKRTALPTLLLLVAMTSCTASIPETVQPGQPEYTAPTTACMGMPGKPAGSESYRTGAPDNARDGDDLVVTVTVRLQTAAGTCLLAKGALIEIWHTGDGGRYRDDAWRTARRTGTDGTVSYQTVRPTPEENFPHLHVRVTPRSGEPEDWVVGITPDTPRELQLDLLAGTATSTTTSIAPAGGTGV